MSYCTVQDVRFALTQAAATSGTHTAADMDDATIQDSVNEATAQVDAYISGPYKADDIIPEYIKFWTRDIAAFLAASVYRKSKDWTTLDPLYIRWQDCINLLTAVSSGALDIVGPGNAGVTDEMGTVANWSNIQLFYPWNFDLFGKGAWQYPGAYPVIRYTYIWPGYGF